MTTSNSSQSTLVLVLHILLTILLPPVGVFLKVGIGLHFWLNILLTILGVLPGQIHGIWVLLKK
ncbi:MAG: YqaE/Pmp3 family membrane protein [Phycisphaerales bacterium]